MEQSLKQAALWEEVKDKLKKSDDELFNGAFWSGKTACEFGLVDAISDMRSAMKNKFGDKIKVVNIEPKKKGLIKELLSSKFNIAGDIKWIEQ